MRARPALPAVVLLTALTACGGGGSKLLSLGTEKDVAFKTTPTDAIPATDTTLGVTVLAVRVGAISELTDGGFQVKDEQKDSTPMYVDVTYKNKGTVPIPRNNTVGMEKSNGESIPTTLVFSLSNERFGPCPDQTGGTLAPGESYESCTLFLVPKGDKPHLVRFVSQSPDNKITFTDWAVK